MFRKSILASTLSLLLLPSGAWALGLGGIRAESALNQPFVGEIALIGANPDRLDTVKVVLAAEAEFAKRGTERQHYLTKLRFKPQISPTGKVVVRVTSAEPIREPYMDFLVEVIWPNGRLVKGYTVLLDPPVTARRSPPPVAPPVTESSVAAAAASAAPLAQARATSAEITPPARSAVQPTPPAGGETANPPRYAPIKPGTALWRVARELTPAGATIHQTAMALYRNNQQAFVRGNINKLRLGEVLQVPSSAEIFAMDAGTAEREFRTALRGKPVMAKPLTDVLVAAPEGDSRLKIAGATQSAEPLVAPTEGQTTQPTGGPATPDIEQELLLVRETGESTRQETDELRARVHQLESSLADIQQLLTLRDAELARLQGGQVAGPVLTDTAPADTAAAQAPRDGDMGQPSGTYGLDETAPGVSPTGSTATPVQPQPEIPVEPPPVAGAEPAGAKVMPGDAVGGLQAVAPEDRVVPDGSAVPAAPTPPPDESESSWLDGVPVVGGALKALPAPLLWSGLVAVPVLGILGWLSARRRRSEERFADFGLPTSANLDDGRAERSAEMDEPFLSEAEEAEQSSIESHDEEGPASDLISEADIYIAYGRYRDAEDLLKQGIARYPRRADLRYRLADVYAGARNYDGLSALIAEMERAGMNEEDPEQWNRLASQARSPGEPAAASAGVGAPAAGPVSWGLGELGSGDTSQRAAGGGRDPKREPGYFAPPARDVNGFAPDGADSLAMDFSRHQDQSVGLETLDLGPVVTTAEPEVPGRQPNSAQGPAGKADTGLSLELEMSDLTPATEFDLAELGVLAPTPAVPRRADADSPKAPVLDSEQEFNFEPIVGLDTIPAVEADEGTAPATEDLAQAWAQPVRLPGGPMRAGGDGMETDRFKLEPNEQDTVSSELFSSQWHMDAGAWDEAATKLDLGRAYVEMADRQAAEELLLEVAEEGNPEQQAEARELLERIKPN